MPKIVVSSFMVPSPGVQFESFCKLLVTDNAPGRLEIKGMVLIDGPGCANYAFIVEGDDVENWANQITAKLLGKWEYTEDAYNLLKEGVFEDLRDMDEYILRNASPKPTIH